LIGNRDSKGLGYTLSQGPAKTGCRDPKKGPSLKLDSNNSKTYWLSLLLSSNLSHRLRCAVACQLGQVGHQSWLGLINPKLTCLRVSITILVNILANWKKARDRPGIARWGVSPSDWKMGRLLPFPTCPLFIFSSHNRNLTLSRSLVVFYMLIPSLLNWVGGLGPIFQNVLPLKNQSWMTWHNPRQPSQVVPSTHLYPLPLC